MNMLLEVAKLQQCLGDHSYTPQEGTKFVIRERGKVRNVTSIPPVDKTINHLLCDEMLTPRMDPQLIHDNAASRVNKGTAFHRRRFIQHLTEFYRRNGSNDGYILLGDFKNYYGSIDRKKAREYMLELMGIEDPELEADTEWLLETILPDGMGVNLGGQPSQNVGISFANRIDTLVKTVEGQRFYGRYSDDFYCIHESREYLVGLREKISGEASKIGLTVHPNKTYIFELVSPITQVVIKYPTTRLIHIGTRSNKTMQESNDWIGITKPDIYPIKSLKECIEAAKKLNSNEQVTKEGFVVVDADWNRIKIKSPEYLALHHMVNNHNYSKDRMVEMIRSGVDIEELISNIPDCAHVVRYYQWQIAELRHNAAKMIYKARSLYNEFSFDRKAVANEIKNDRYAALGFMALGNERSCDDILNSLSDAQFNKYINEYEYNR